jgi:hypothetical protein
LNDEGIYSGTKTSTLTLSRISRNYSGYHFDCIVTATDWNGKALYSESAKLTVLLPRPAIILHPSDRTILEGSGTTFSVTTVPAIGNNTIQYEYQWQYRPDTNADFNDVASDGIYSNATTAILTLTDVPITNNGSQYRCKVSATNYNMGALFSNSATLTVEPLSTERPAIITHPEDVSIQQGVNISFAVTTANPEKIKYQYQWQHRPNANSDFSDVSNSGIYSSARTATLLLTNVPINYEGYQYRCIVMAREWQFQESSDTATLNVTIDIIPPKITTTSLPEAEEGKFYSVTLKATGTIPITWNLITSSLPAGLSLNANTGVISGMPSKSGSYQFTVRARNIAAYDTKVFGFIVAEPKAPVVIEISPPSTSEPFCTANDILSIPFKKIDEVNPMKYSLRFSEDAKAVGFKDTPFENLPTDMAFKIDVPKGAPSKSYSAVIIITREGAGEFQDEYPFVFSITNNGIVIVNQPPAFQLLCGGASIALAVDVAGKASDYQWYINGQAIVGAKGKEYFAEKEGIYYVEVQGECGVVRSLQAVVTSPSSIPGSIIVKVKWGTTMYVENASDKYQSFQWYRDGNVISGASFVYLYEPDGFKGEYYVRCFKADGSFDETCPVVFEVLTRSGFVGVYPTVLKINDVLNINITDNTLIGLGGMEATVEIYSLLGVKVYSTKINTPVATIRPNFRNKGNYIVLIKLPSGEVYSEKIVVQ